MQKIRKLPIGIQSFEKLRESGYIYIDKTEFIYSLVHTGQIYFLSRPRRFGKSLFLSTLKAYFEGKKELFAGLKIKQLEEDNPDAWKPYPVIYLNFAQNSFSKENSLEKTINLQLEEYEKKYTVQTTFTDSLDSTNFAGRFINIVQTARKKTGLPAVVLIDEYDKPLLDAQSNESLVNDNRETLRGLYVTLKALDEDLKFVFLTGVTKFSKVSIFSDLNQLNDISITSQYATACGIT
ncbi:MAG: AAA family ATPase, partial [Treponema sp.]|nr:AAA family ATPase [Treponema sp.]